MIPHGLVIGDGSDIVVLTPSQMKIDDLAVFWLAATNHDSWPGVDLSVPLKYRFINNLLGLLNENSSASVRYAFHKWDGRTEYRWTTPPAGSRLHYVFYPNEVGSNDEHGEEQAAESRPWTPLVWPGGQISATPPTTNGRPIASRYWASADAEQFTSGLIIEDITGNTPDAGGGDVTTMTYTLDNPAAEPSPAPVRGWATNVWLSWVAGKQRLRQRQRDDFRHRQSDSRQLTARQRGYF